LEAYGKTDAGRLRNSSQDAFICARLSESALFCAVCDGMGGVNGGNVASSIAIKVISDRIMDVYRDGLSSNSIRNLFETAIAAANIEIYDSAMADENLRGMGTTVVATLVVGRRLHLAHVGDSRAYLVGDSGMVQITKDHSVVQAMVEKGQLTQKEAKNHPRKHFITRALGAEDTVKCDYCEQELDEGDRVLICTDGLTNMMETDEIYRIIQSVDTESVPERLIHEANMVGGSDNITVVVIA